MKDQRSTTFPSVMVKNEMNLNLEGFNCDEMMGGSLKDDGMHVNKQQSCPLKTQSFKVHHFSA